MTHNTTNILPSPYPATADVVLSRTIGRTANGVFTYGIPTHLHHLIQLGQLVWVPLRSQSIQGVIWRVHTTPQRDKQSNTLRFIEDIADPEAIIPAPLLQLANHIATTYLAPLYTVLKLCLPPATAQTALVTWYVTPHGRTTAPAMLIEPERSILYYLQKHGETTERDMVHTLTASKERLHHALYLLSERGLVARGTTRSSPTVRPRLQRVVQSQLCPDDVAARAAQLTNAPKQRAVLVWLATQPSDMPIPVGDVYRATNATLATLHALERKQLVRLTTQNVERIPEVLQHGYPDEPPLLTSGQRRVWDAISSALDTLAAPPHAPQRPMLLHGVTGSGKTEIYLRAIAYTLRHKRQALLLVPEIALTTQLVRRVTARFPGRVAILNSALSRGERYDGWRRVRRGEATIVVGSRSALFAPFTALGVIIVDEEHEASYKQDDMPHYHARDMAIELARITGSVVILGSATPDVASYHAAKAGTYQLLELPDRIGTLHIGEFSDRGNTANLGITGITIPLPQVHLVDMRHELHENNRSLFSRALHDAMAHALAHNEQILLFLNRRGAATFVMCRDCGTVITCPTCHRPLVVHYRDDAHDQGDETASILTCHTCCYRTHMPTWCLNCFSTRIKSFGAGTQRVAHEVQRYFPSARTLRWDSDSTHAKESHTHLFDAFCNHEADVLIGTQMIAKGLDMPHVSVVGVVAADIGLHLPDFRSGERTFQLLTQVAGRAGRRRANAQVFIQTYTPEHYVLQAAREHNYHAFYRQEIAFRRQVGYPPYGRLVRFVVAHRDKATCQQHADTLANHLHAFIARHALANTGVGIIGPAPAFLQRVHGRWRWHIIVRLSTDESSAIVATMLQELPDMHGWTIDVDPVHVL